MSESKPCPLCGRAAILVSTGAAIQENADQPGGGGRVLGYAGKMLCKNRTAHPDGQPWSEPAGMVPVDEHRDRTVNLHRQQMAATVVAQVKMQLTASELAVVKQAIAAARDAHADGGSWFNVRSEVKPLVAAVTDPVSRLRIKAAIKTILDECQSFGQGCPEALASAGRAIGAGV